MPPKKRRTGGTQPDATRTHTRPVSNSPLHPPTRASALHDSPRHIPAVRYRPGWHRLIAVTLLVVGVALAETNDMELIGGPHPPLPGGHNEGYLLLAGAIEATSMWCFGLFDRPH